jgi:hypothetical protein
MREVTARTGPRGYVGKHVCFLGHDVLTLAR